MRTFLVIGDVHFKWDNAYFTDLLHKVLEEHLQTTHYDEIVVLGDVLDRHEQIHVMPLERLHRFLKMLSTFTLTIVIIGNHDRPNDNDFLTPIHPLIGLQIADLPTLRIVSDVQRFGDYVYVPYVPKNRFREALSRVDLTGVQMIFAHQEIKGAQLGAVVSDITETWTPEDPPVISGHIHNYQRVFDNWIYVGTPFPHTYGEEERKTVSVVTAGVGEGSKDPWVESRLRLMLPGRKLEHLTIQDIRQRLTGWTHPINMRLKWKIAGPRQDLQRMAKTPEYQKLTEGIKIEYEYTDKIMQSAVTQTQFRPYLTILQERLATNPLAQTYLNALISQTQAV
jgi:DNA repair exonuclease SbcCD nuclease subunit